MTIVYFIILISLLNTPAFAYIGPGMGGGVIAAVVGIVGAFFLLVFGVLYYPIKKAFKKAARKKKK